MELADGSLADLLEVYRVELGTGLPADHLCPLLGQAAQALDFLNTRQHLLNDQWVTVQHCDVTPTNLLLFEKTVKLTDFGLTTTLASTQKSHYRSGTPDYAAPEVFQGRLSERTDQYALAVCYCVLRGGRLPFPDTPAGLAPGYVRPAPDLSMLTAGESQVIARALTPVPQDRWHSCGEMLAHLERLARPQAEGEKDWQERRQGERYRPTAALRCEVVASLGNEAWTATVQNISAGGIRLRVARPGCPLRPGRVLALALWNEGCSMRRVVQVRLSHGVETADGDYEVGGPFERALTPEELKALTQGGLA
jgi:serine/threonine protein kinase